MMKSLTFAFFFLFLCLNTQLVGAIAPKSIFILAGQSNMAGRGNMIREDNGSLIWDGVVPPKCKSNPSILGLAFNLTWVVANEPLHADIDRTKAKVCGVGPGMAFANQLLKRDATFGVIGLVPCAIGGTYMNEWLPGKAYYNQMIKRTTAALHCGRQIRALLWYQGESDTEGERYPSSFARDLEFFFKSVRNDLGLPKLPIIQVAVPLAIKGPYVKDIRKFQLQLKLPLLSTVDANGSQLQGDQVHRTSNAQVHLGIKMANAFLHMSHR